jgi:hypothetical protein
MDQNKFNQIFDEIIQEIINQEEKTIQLNKNRKDSFKRKYFENIFEELKKDPTNNELKIYLHKAVQNLRSEFKSSSLEYIILSDMLFSSKFTISKIFEIIDSQDNFLEKNQSKQNISEIDILEKNFKQKIQLINSKYEADIATIIHKRKQLDNFLI